MNITMRHDSFWTGDRQWTHIHILRKLSYASCMWRNWFLPVNNRQWRGMYTWTPDSVATLLRSRYVSRTVPPSGGTNGAFRDEGLRRVHTPAFSTATNDTES